MTIGIRLRRVPALALVAGLLAGCVYYNGMYNTNRLVRSARKAERENRPFEASNLWGQVITRAESVSVRHPHSKYAPQANVLRGLALSRLNQCQQAVIPLGQVALLPPGDFAEEATLALGRCQMETGDPASADLAFRQLLDSRDEVHRRQARFEHGRALRMTGHYDEAIPFLRETTGPRAGDELLLALSGAGHDDEADSLVTLLLASGDSTRVWDSLVVAMGRQRPGSADSLIDRLATQPGTSAAQRARRMYDEALRLETVDSTRYLARLRQAATVGVKSEGGQQATLRLFRRQIAQAENVAALAPIADSLEAFSGIATAVNADASQLATAVGRVRSASDSGAAGIPQGDLRLFLAAESSRDSLLAPRVAGELFRRIAIDWPKSPYAPKALLAIERLDSTWADSARLLLAERYIDSPYLAMLRGEDADGYRVLEDSLLQFAVRQPVVAAPTEGVRRRPGGVVEPPGARRRPRDPDAPGSSPRGGRRLEP